MNTKSKQPLLSFPKPKFTTGMIRLSITLLFSTLCIGSFGQKKSPITVETLLEEMTSYDEMTRYPALPYRSMQQSSYDRRSVSPDRPGWFANDDGEGFIRLEEHNGRKEKVLSKTKVPAPLPVYGSRPLAAYIQSCASILTERTNQAGWYPLMISKSSVYEDSRKD
mgnify:CR=1 FL=1